MGEGRERARGALGHLGLFLLGLLAAALTGCAGGLLGSLFHGCVDYAARLREANPWILYLLPAGGALIALIYRWLGMERHGTNDVIDAVVSEKPVPWRLIPAIFAGTVITHLCGGSAGREGAALQLGGGVGTIVARALRLGERERRMVTMCGMASVFSALFGTPLTAAFFALEMERVGEMPYEGLAPCLLASLCACRVAALCGIAPTRFAVALWPEATLLALAGAAALAVACAFVSAAFSAALRAAEDALPRKIKNPCLLGALGGLVLIGMGLLAGTGDYNGAGMDTIARAIGGSARPEAFALKIAFTVVTIASGFKGGEVVPTFFAGATLGCVLGPLLGLPAGFSAALGLCALFCGMVNCPVTSILLAWELFGGQGLVFFAVACAVSYALSGNFGLYSHQRLRPDKLRYWIRA